MHAILLEAKYKDMDTTQINEWIDVINNVPLPESSREKKIQELVSLWKFTTCYDKDIKLSDSLKLAIPGKNKVEAVVFDLDFAHHPYSDAINKVLEETEIKLLHAQKEGFYTITFTNRPANFTSVSLTELSYELADCFDGKLITYNYIKQVQKTSLLKHRLHTNLKVKTIERSDIVKILEENSAKYTANNEDKWLILVLDNHQSKCDHFLIQDDVLNSPFTSSFEKIFLFDFFKSQIIPLTTVPKS
mgnify:CR=1 FL=1